MGFPKIEPSKNIKLSAHRINCEQSVIREMLYLIQWFLISYIIVGTVFSCKKDYYLPTSYNEQTLKVNKIAKTLLEPLINWMTECVGNNGVEIYRYKNTESGFFQNNLDDYTGFFLAFVKTRCAFINSKYIQTNI